MFMFSMGYQVSGATRVGQNLGSGRPKTARRAAMMGPSLALLTSCVLAVILLTFRNEIPYLFTGSDGPGQRELAMRVAATYGYLSLYVVGDGVSNSFGGVIQGSGKQSYGAVVVIVSYFVIALPICYFAGLQGGGGYVTRHHHRALRPVHDTFHAPQWALALGCISRTRTPHNVPLTPNS